MQAWEGNAYRTEWGVTRENLKMAVWPRRLKICGISGLTEAAGVRRKSEEKSCENRVQRETSPDGRSQEAPWSREVAPTGHRCGAGTLTGGRRRRPAPPLQAPGEVKEGIEKAGGSFGTITRSLGW